MTKGCRTLDGRKPEYIKEFGLVELDSPNYRDRTIKNVQQSDCTVCFAYDWGTPGERCTATACYRYNKPRYTFNVRISVPNAIAYVDDSVQRFLDLTAGCKVINIAGNAEKRAPGLEAAVYKFLVEAFNAV